MAWPRPPRLRVARERGDDRQEIIRRDVRADTARLLRPAPQHAERLAHRRAQLPDRRVVTENRHPHLSGQAPVLGAHLLVLADPNASLRAEIGAAVSTRSPARELLT